MNYTFRSALKTAGAAAAALLAATALLAAQQPAAASHAATPTAASSASTAAQTATSPVVVTVGTQQVRLDVFNALIAGAPAEQQPQMMSDKHEVASELGKMLALAQEAQRRGLDRQSALEAQMLLDRSNMLVQALEEQIAAQSKPSAAVIQAYYQAHSGDFVELKVRHILVGDAENPASPTNPRSQAEALAKAQQLETRLKTEDFAAVAKSDSDDKASGANGGELGTIEPGKTVPEFEAAVWALPVGKISDPIHTRFGYHIVQVEARTPMSLADATPAISDKLQTQAVQQAIDRITSGATITINDAAIGVARGR